MSSTSSFELELVMFKVAGLEAKHSLLGLFRDRLRSRHIFNDSPVTSNVA